MMAAVQFMALTRPGSGRPDHRLHGLGIGGHGFRANDPASGDIIARTGHSISCTAVGRCNSGSAATGSIMNRRTGLMCRGAKYVLCVRNGRLCLQWCWRGLNLDSIGPVSVGDAARRQSDKASHNEFLHQ